MSFHDDKSVLIEILMFIRSVLNELIESHIIEDKALFQSAWSTEVRPHLDDLINQLKAVSREGAPLWRAVQNGGLTAEQLKLKRARLVAASSKGITKKILDIINTLLGSIPGAEPVKEFKEFAEEALDDPNASITAKLV